MKKLPLKITLLLSLVFGFMFNTVTHANDANQAMIVFDASGSMWGQIDGKAKITIAKQAINKVVTNWDENVHLGLMAYGHRKKGDCNDIQTLVPINKINITTILTEVKKINPKGKTPISRSIKQAAEALKFTEEKSTVILISDGKETCDPDPCATAKLLEQQGIDFVTHVVGFNVDKQTDEQLQCIASATGGEYFSAKNATALNEAITVIAEKVTQEEPPKPVIKTLKNNIEITASETEGGKWIKAYHQIYKKEGDNKTRVTSCSSTKKAACIQKLPAGDYVIASSYNKLKKETAVQLSDENNSEVHIIMGSTGKADISATEEEGGKWIKAYHQIFTIDGDDKTRITSCSSTKKKACPLQLPVGSYSIESSYNKLKKKTDLEITAGETTEINIIMGSTGKVEITTSEEEGGKWVQAYHQIFSFDGDDKTRITSCSSTKKKACLQQLPVGSYSIESRYNKLRKKTELIVTTGDVTELNIVMGSTGKVEITASEEEGGKWVQAHHQIFAIDGDDKTRITSCSSTKKKACLQQLPVGNYSIESRYDKLRQKSTVDVIAGKITPVNIVMGQTGKIEITASEEDGGKWVNAYHQIFTVEGEDKTRIASCGSSKKKACLQKLAVGQYTIESRYEKLTKKTVVEVTAGQTSQVNLVMGQLGKMEITASEEEGGKWVDALHEIYKVENDDLIRQKSRMSGQKRAYVELYPVGEYKIKSSYKGFKKETSFTLKPGETTSVNVVMGQTGKVEISASETQGGKWVQAYHELYSINNGDRERIRGRYSKKNTPYTEQLPVGNYVITSKYNRVSKETLFEVTASKTTSVQVIFAPYSIEAKCSNSSDRVLHEIYSSKGRLVFEKKAKCSDVVTTSLDNGAYTVDTTVGNVTKSTKITVGPDSPTSLSIDLSKPVDSNETPTDQEQKELIEADSEKQASTINTKPSAASHKELTPEKETSDNNASKEKKVDKHLEALKQSIIASLPKFKEATACYKNAENLEQLKNCESLEQEASTLAQKAMESVTGSKIEKIEVDEHSDWNDEIKIKLIKEKDNDINKMELSLVCFDKGASLMQLEKCIANNGNL